MVPSFSHGSYPQSGSGGLTDMLSPLSNTADRYFPSNLLSGGSVSRGSFNRHNSLDSYEMQLSRQGGKHLQPLQPLQLREPYNRSRPEILQSPLRTSMSWKGESLDYNQYQTAGPLSPSNTTRQPAVYQVAQGGTDIHHYNTDTYAGQFSPQFNETACADTLLASNIQASPLQNASSQSTDTQLENAPMPRFRSASAVYPSGYDFRPQYSTRPMSSLSSGNFPRTTTFSPAYNSSGLQSAPLLAPSEFQAPRTPLDPASREYNLAQMSAPIAAPRDFATAYSQSLSPRQSGMQSQQPQSEPSTNLQQSQQHELHSAQAGENNDYTTTENFNAGGSRKRTFSMTENYEGA